jgi:hypothetical protein
MPVSVNLAASREVLMVHRAWIGVAVAGLVLRTGFAQESPPPKPAERSKEPAAAKPEKGYPYLELERKGRAGDVIRTALKVKDEAKCDRCGGDGEVVIEEVKYPKSNPRSNVPLKEGVKRTRREKCDGCGASGLCTKANFILAMDNFAKAICGMKDGDPKTQEAMDKAVEHLQAALRGKSEPAGRAFAEVARRRTNDQPLVLGTPVYWVGYLMDDPSAVGESRPLRIGTTRNAPDAAFWVSEPVLSRAAKGERVVVGGVFAGRQTLGDNKSVPVAQGGWIVVVP